jgi:hypothetical protein
MVLSVDVVVVLTWRNPTTAVMDALIVGLQISRFRDWLGCSRCVGKRNVRPHPKIVAHRR